MVGDVGGSNVRLELLKLSKSDIDEREVVKALVKYNPQKVKSL